MNRNYDVYVDQVHYPNAQDDKNEDHEAHHRLVEELQVLLKVNVEPQQVRRLLQDLLTNDHNYKVDIIPRLNLPPGHFRPICFLIIHIFIFLVRQPPVTSLVFLLVLIHVILFFLQNLLFFQLGDHHLVELCLVVLALDGFAIDGEIVLVVKNNFSLFFFNSLDRLHEVHVKHVIQQVLEHKVGQLVQKKVTNLGLVRHLLTLVELIELEILDRLVHHQDIILYFEHGV